jgi:rubrerythrin
MPGRTKPTTPLAMGDHLRWEVRWVKKDDREGYRIVCIDCEDDLDEAIRIYVKAKSAGKKMATLRCRNSGFPPPQELRPYTKRKSRIVTRRRKKVKEYYLAVFNPMRKQNNKGIYWCPYCRELRRFQTQNGFLIQGVFVPEPGLHCPICGTSHRDYHVRRWNPLAARTYLAGQTTGNKIKKKRWTLDGID